MRESARGMRYLTSVVAASAGKAPGKCLRRRERFPYLLCKPAKMPDLPAPSNAHLPQLLSDLGDHSGEQVTDVAMDGSEPGLGSG